MFIFVVYRITYFAALIGYSMLMLEIFGVSAWINENILADDSAFAFKLVRKNQVTFLPHLSQYCSPTLLPVSAD
jgi:hypothetical protein